MKKILITTGGSGGHVIPSLSIYDALKDEFEVQIATDMRGSKYIKNNNYKFSIIDAKYIIKFLISSIEYNKIFNFNIKVV